MKYLYAALLLLVTACSTARAVNLAWDYTQGGDPAVSFRVYRAFSPVGDCQGVLAVYTTLPATQQTFTDTAVTTGGIYCYKVTAVDAQGLESDASNVLSVHVLKRGGVITENSARTLPAQSACLCEIWD